MLGTNCWTTAFNTLRKHQGISIFKIPKAKSGIPEHIKWKERHLTI